MAIAEASAALGGIRAALDIVKSAWGLQSASDINLAVIEIQRALLDAQGAALDDRERQAGLQSRIAELEAELAKVHRWEAEKARYKLTETETGKLVYELRPDYANGDPDHRLCVKCFDEDRKSVLQIANRHSGGESVECPHCKVKLILKAFPTIKAERTARLAGY